MTEPLPGAVSAPARRGLAEAGIGTLGDVAARREVDLAALHGVGPAASTTGTVG